MCRNSRRTWGAAVATPLRPLAHLSPRPEGEKLIPCKERPQ